MMEKTTRRNLLRAAAVGGVTATGLGSVLGAGRGVAALGAAEQKPDRGSEHAHDNRPLTGKRAMAVVSFGQWDVDPAVPLDRQPINSNEENQFRNVHHVLPFEVEIDAGGAVSFMISGLHQILIYAPGRELADVQAGAAGLPPILGGPPLVNYVTDLVYRGPDPRVLQYLPLAPPPPLTTGNLVIDRVESVNFKEPGRYLVVCGVLPHFLEGMHGYVSVKA
jgi:plastocyanin